MIIPSVPSGPGKQQLVLHTYYKVANKCINHKHYPLAKAVRQTSDTIRHFSAIWVRVLPAAATESVSSAMQAPHHQAYYQQQQQQQYVQQQTQPKMSAYARQAQPEEHGFNSANWEAERARLGLDQLQVQVSPLSFCQGLY